jgi:hypothetical protein
MLYDSELNFLTYKYKVLNSPKLNQVPEAQVRNLNYWAQKHQIHIIPMLAWFNTTLNQLVIIKSIIYSNSETWITMEYHY